MRVLRDGDSARARLRQDGTAQLGAPLKADEVRGKAVAAEAFALLDAVAAQDARVDGWKLA